MRLALLAAGLLISFASAAAAQGFGGYVTAGSGSIDYLIHRETIPQGTVGVLWHAASGRIRVGGEADVMTSNGYVSGRGGPLAEVVLVKGRVQPFVRGGYFVGEDSSWIAGGGVDIWLTPTAGLRLMVQDAFRGLRGLSSFDDRRSTLHEPSFQIGWAWR
jgi:hypothetical protein